MRNKALLLINTGTPEKPELKEVRSFLSEFLNDKRVIDLPWLIRKILVNLIIVPFRSPKSTRLYKKVWSDMGSPLLYNLNNLVSKVQDQLKDEYQVYGAMRYGKPSLDEVLKQLKTISPERIVVFPLYPHYASSTTGSVNSFIMKEMKSWNIIPEVVFSGQFYSHPSYIRVLGHKIKKYDYLQVDHILFSYHGLPLSHIRKIHPDIDCSLCKCDEMLPDEGSLCYKATCYETSRLLAAELNIKPGSYSTSFQSRLSKDWLSPFTDNTLKKLAGEGKKRVLVVAPSFVADCLETIIEINEEYQSVFQNAGGTAIIPVECLNDDEKWAEAIIKIAAL
jgi:ferrochelatase